jgi:nicotinamidase/pyrazinamidase
MEITLEDVLIVVDVQNDFCLGGALEVPRGDEVIDAIHATANKFQHVVLTQDWHPKGHVSFVTGHPGRKMYETIEVAYGSQILWPEHCIQGTHGSEFHPGLRLPQAELILRKGFRAEIDSYSAFFENDHSTPTGLAGYLRERGLNRVFLAGLAYDFCVGSSALDARRLGFAAIVLRQACRGININASLRNMENQFREAGVDVIDQIVG